MKSLGQIVGEVKKGLQAAEIAAPEAVAKAALGLEDSSVDGAFVEEATNTVSEIVRDALDEVPGLEDAQIQAAQYGALLDQDTTAAIGARRVMPAVESGKQVVVQAGAFGESDVYSDQLVAMESFDGQVVSSNTPYSFAVNMVMARQDEFTETIYPTVVLKPGVSGCAVAATVEKIEGQYLRSNASADRLKRNSVSLVKALIDADSILAGEKTRLVPVLNATNAEVLVDTLAYDTTVTGETIRTAPIKPDVDAPLMGISQTAAQLSQGVRDNTDAMDDTVILENVYYTLTDGTDTSTHVINVSGYTSARWVPTASGHSKDIALNFVSDSLVISVDNTKQVDGSASAVLDNLNMPGHTIVVRGVLYGSGNTEIGDLSVSKGKFELLELRDAAGNVVPQTDAKFTTVKGIIDAMEFIGYEVDAYATNSNLRQTGYILSAETVNTIYSVGYRTPISVLKPQIHTADVDNDANKIKSFGNQARAMSTVLGINKLLKYAGFLRNATENGIELVTNELAGAAKDLVNPYYTNKEIDLATVVDSTNSKDITANIKGAISAVIAQTVNEMMDGSGYLDAFENTNMNLGAKPTIIIATDRKIKAALTGDGQPLDLGGNVNVKVVATGSKQFINKIMVMPTTGSKALNVLNFGFRAFVPTPTVEVKRSINGTSINALYNQPAFEFVNLLPILAEFDVTGFETVTKKIPQNVHTV